MRGRPLTLSVPSMPATATLRVDGNLAVPVDESPLDSYRATAPHRWRIAEDASRDGFLDLELRVNHRMSRSGWIDAVPELSTDPRGSAWIAGVHAWNTITAIGALAAASFVTILYGFLSLLLRDERRRSYAWFTLGATSGLVYPAFLLGLTQPVFGVFEAPFTILALVLGSITSMHFSRAYVSEPPPSRLWWFVFVGAVVVMILARDPFVSLPVMGPLVVAVTIATAIAQFAFIARLRRSGKKRTMLVFAVALAWPAAVLFGLPDAIAWVGHGEATSGIRTASLGIMLLSISEAIALSYEHILSLRRADALNDELEERVHLLQAQHRELELMSDELRRQIAARSRELAEKLALVSDQGPVAPPVLDPGMTIEDRYRILRMLGAGGMGAVYEVERIADGKHFALKALASGGDSQARARFAREAQICANVNHPNVVSIVDVDVAETGFVFLVMELVEGGKTLHDVRKRDNEMSWSLHVLAQVAAGIDAIHAAGVVHRDLKPGNILVRTSEGEAPTVKITDFGISSLKTNESFSSIRVNVRDEATDSTTQRLERTPFENPESTGTMMLRASEDTDSSPTRVERAGSAKPSAPPKTPLTETGVIFGTPHYMAQELARGTKSATRSADVFSLGIIAFELLTGKRPFSESPVTARLAGRALTSPPSLLTLVPSLPPDIANVLDRAISHEPHLRPTAREVFDAIRAAPV